MGTEVRLCSSEVPLWATWEKPYFDVLDGHGCVFSQACLGTRARVRVLTPVSREAGQAKYDVMYKSH